MISRRSFVADTSASLALPHALPQVGHADSFPNGPFRILVPFGPGSATDQSARRVAEAGARKAVAQLGVGEAEAPKHLTADQRALRHRLRVGRVAASPPRAR